MGTLGNTADSFGCLANMPASLGNNTGMVEHMKGLLG